MYEHFTSDKLVDAREYGANKIKDAVRIKQTIRINRCEKKKNRINQIEGFALNNLAFDKY